MVTQCIIAKGIDADRRNTNFCCLTTLIVYPMVNMASGHVINLPQDVASFPRSLPWLPSDLEVIVARKENTPTHVSSGKCKQSWHNHWWQIWCNLWKDKVGNLALGKCYALKMTVPHLTKWSFFLSQGGSYNEIDDIRQIEEQFDSDLMNISKNYTNTRVTQEVLAYLSTVPASSAPLR